MQSKANMCIYSTDLFTWIDELKGFSHFDYNKEPFVLFIRYLKVCMNQLFQPMHPVALPSTGDT